MLVFTHGLNGVFYAGKTYWKLRVIIHWCNLPSNILRENRIKRKRDEKSRKERKRARQRERKSTTRWPRSVAKILKSVCLPKSLKYRWVPLCPNVVKSKLAFIQSSLKTTCQSLLCYSACSIWNSPKSMDFHSVLFVRIKRDPPPILPKWESYLLTLSIWCLGFKAKSSHLWVLELHWKPSDVKRTPGGWSSSCLARWTDTSHNWIIGNHPHRESMQCFDDNPTPPASLSLFLAPALSLQLSPVYTKPVFC